MKKPIVVLFALSHLALTVLAACESEGAFTTLSDAADAGADGADDGDAADADADTGADTGADTSTGPHPALVDAVEASFEVRAGVETVTVTAAAPGALLTLYDAAGERLVTIEADEHGQAHFAYVPAEHMLLDLANISSSEVVVGGTTVRPGGGYVVRDDTVDPPAAVGPFQVLDVDDTPDTALYDGQVLQGVHYGITGYSSDPNDGFNYITVRDGVQIGVMVRLPDKAIWGDGPYPTVVEYSGYSPSNPNRPDAGSNVATLLGWASVGVNMRGTGCSGGVFDIFNAAQQADGYDVIETVARQQWVLGHRVGMVGLSYSGISQLFVAHTNPPHLAAITAQSVIADPWAQLWPGGIYNDGFTRQWLEERDREAAPGGQRWTDERIDLGDAVCEAHQQLRNQNIAFEQFFKQLEFYPLAAAERSLPSLVGEIALPVYLTGAFQDEQTGGQFAEMLDRFASAPVTRFIVYNGRHIDGYSPMVLTRWWEFLELYVARRVPKLPQWMRDLAGPEFSKIYGVEGLGFEPDRFPDLGADDYVEALARYEAEPPVRVLFDNGAAVPGQPGAPMHRFELSADQWPPATARALELYLGPDGSLAEDAPTAAGQDSYRHDPDAGDKTFFGPAGYELFAPLWDLDWTYFPAGKSLSYLTAPLTEDVVTAGPAYVDLLLSSEAADVNVQVTLTEVRPDGTEYLVQWGWLRAGHDNYSVAGPADAEITYSYLEEDFTPLEPGAVRAIRVPMPSFAHAFRAGSRLRLEIATPGRNHGTWEFTNPDYDGAEPVHTVAWGPDAPSLLHLSIIDGVAVAEGYPPCPSLRGQPCRPWPPTEPGLPTSCSGGCAETTLRATPPTGASEGLDDGRFGLNIYSSGDPTTLHIEVSAGGDGQCPTEGSPTPNYLMTLNHLPLPLHGDVLTEADGLTVTLIDFATDLLPEGTIVATASELTLTPIAASLCDRCAAPITDVDDDAFVAFDLEATLVDANGTAAGALTGHVYATPCDTLFATQ